MIPEPNHLNPLRLQPGRTLSISPGNFCPAMMSTIKLYRQLSRRAVKVQNEVVDAKLSHKAPAPEPTMAQILPEVLLSRS